MSRFREGDWDVKNGAIVVNPTYMPVPAIVEPTGNPSLVVLIFYVLKCEHCHWEPLTAVEERANAT